MRARLHAITARPAPTLGANLTPMIDLIFLLIIFFMVVAQISRQHTVEVELPAHSPTAARMLIRDGILTLNIIPEADRDRLGGAYSLGGVVFPDDPGISTAMARSLTLARAEVPDLEIIIRADRAERYSLVSSAMRAARESGAPRIHLAALEKEPTP